MNITDEQWQELCEMVGFKEYPKPTGTPLYGWYYPDGTQSKGKYDWMQPPPKDMNTLFKWMVPKYLESITKDGYVDLDGLDDIITPLKKALIHKEDPFEALVQAIYKALKGHERAGGKAN